MAITAQRVVSYRVTLPNGYAATFTEGECRELIVALRGVLGDTGTAMAPELLPALPEPTASTVGAPDGRRWKNADGGMTWDDERLGWLRAYYADGLGRGDIGERTGLTYAQITYGEQKLRMRTEREERQATQETEAPAPSPMSVPDAVRSGRAQGWNSKRTAEIYALDLVAVNREWGQQAGAEMRGRYDTRPPELKAADAGFTLRPAGE